MSQVQHVIENAMTGRQIIEAIESYGDLDVPMFFVCDYGDRYHTQQALPITEIVDAERKHLVESGYSSSGIALREDEGSDETDEPDDEQGCVLIMR